MYACVHVPCALLAYIYMPSLALNAVCAYIAGDDTLKLWDIRAMKRPINVAAGLESVYAVTSCVFSPDDQLVSTGTSVRRGQVRLTCLLQSMNP